MSTQKAKTPVNLGQGDMGPLWKETLDLIIRDMEKADVLNDFASVFTGNCSCHSTQVVDSNGKNLEKVDLLL